MSACLAIERGIPDPIRHKLGIFRLHLPDATQIVDWYHASHYIWQAAPVIAGPDSAQRTA